MKKEVIPSSDDKYTALQSNSQLAEALRQGELTAQEIRKLPSQSLYMAIQSAGLEAFSDVLPLFTRDQYALLLDFDFWKKDRLDEERFWNWLEVIEQDNSLELLQQFIHSVDLRIIGVFVNRYVAVQVFDEVTPKPEPAAFTPDGGFTWLTLNFPSADQVRLFGSLLAFIFQSDVELFYQLIAGAQTQSTSELEEDSFQLKNRRLLAEGIPDHEIAWQIHSPLHPNNFLKLIESAVPGNVVIESHSVSPIVHNESELRPLNDLLEQISRDPEKQELFGRELSLIANATLVFYGTGFSDAEETQFILNQFRGALNIGLEKAVELTGLPIMELYNRLGLQPIYRLGHFVLHEVGSLVESIPLKYLEGNSSDPVLIGFHFASTTVFPAFPLFVKTDGKIAAPGGKLLKGRKAYETLAEVRAAVNLLRNRNI